MSETKTVEYRVVSGALHLPRVPNTRGQKLIMQGEVVPSGVFSEEDIARWLKDGRIKQAAEAAPALERASNRHQGKWCVDPATLAGKNMEDLLLMVLEIDPEYDTEPLADEASVVRLLTRDWDPLFVPGVASAKDRSAVVAMTPNGVKGLGTKPMSEVAQAAMAAARAKARAPESE